MNFAVLNAISAIMYMQTDTQTAILFKASVSGGKTRTETLTLIILCFA